MEKNKLADYLIWIADNNVIMGQRLAEWCGHGPYLEEDIALTNLALDHIGQSQLFYDYACELRGKEETQDDLAFERDVVDFKNNILVELPNKDFSFTIAKIYCLSQFQYLLYKELAENPDDRIKNIALKSIKEVKYHVEHSSTWILRLGDGTDESKMKMQNSINEIWAYALGMFIDESIDTELSELEIGVLPSSIQSDWMMLTEELLQEATLTHPEVNWPQTGGRKGRHSEHLGHILSEMQFLQRAYPNSEW